MASAYRPLLDFMIIGAQKCGTTALAHYLGQHPQIGMSSVKEPHLFDAPDYSPAWTPEQIDERYQPFFKHCPANGTPTEKGTPTEQQMSSGVLIRGEATPIYLFLPEIAPELMRYNPNLKLIVLLRDPVIRAISHYYMELNRGYEHLTFWRALLSEPGRLRRCADARRPGSAWRRHSYRRRGLYSRQLRNLYRYFNAGQVLLVRTEHLASCHDETLQRIFRFLGVPPHQGIEARRIFEGQRDRRSHPIASRLLRLSYLPEFIRMRGEHGR